MTLAEVSGMFHVTPETLSSWVHRGRFVKPIRVGRRMLFDRDTVVRWLKTQAEVAGAELSVIELLTSIRDDSDETPQRRKYAAHAIADLMTA